MNKKSYNKAVNEQNRIKSLDTRIQFDIKNSSSLINEYYHHEFNRGMEAIKKISGIHNKILVQHEPKKQELTMSQYMQSVEHFKQQKDRIRQESKKKQSTANIKNEYANIGNQNKLKKQLKQSLGYSRKCDKKFRSNSIKAQSVKLQQQIVKQQVKIVNIVTQEKTKKQQENLFMKRKSSLKPKLTKEHSLLDQIDEDKPYRPQDYSSLLIKSNFENSNLNRQRQVSIISQISPKSQIEKSFADHKSFYSLALSNTSKNKRKNKSKDKSVQQKKNFKKALMQKKYNTSHISQTHHKIEKENQLQVRQIKKLNQTVNFGRIIHQRKNSRDNELEKVRQERSFEKMRKSIERDISEQVVPRQVQQGTARGIFLLKQLQPRYQDYQTPEQNIEIREYVLDDESEDEPLFTNDYSELKQQQFEAIQKTFYNRQNPLKKTTTNISIEKIQQPSQNILFQSMLDQQQIYEKKREELQRQERRYRIIADQLFNFVDNVSFKENLFFQTSLQRLILLTPRIKYERRQSMSTTKQQILLTLHQLIKERQSIDQQNRYLCQRQQELIFLLKDHTYQNQYNELELKKNKFEVGLQKILTASNSTDHIAETQDDQTIQMQKVVIKKLINKIHELVQYNAKQSLKNE